MGKRRCAPVYSSGVRICTLRVSTRLLLPSRNGEAAARRAWRAIETLTSPELMKYFVLHGAAASARYSVAEDYYVLQRNRVIEVIDQLARKRQVRVAPFPVVSGYHGLIQLLSDHLEPLLFDGVQDVHKRIGKLQSALARRRQSARS